MSTMRKIWLALAAMTALTLISGALTVVSFRFSRREKHVKPRQAEVTSTASETPSNYKVEDGKFYARVEGEWHKAPDPIKALRTYCRAHRLHFYIRCEDWHRGPIVFCGKAWHRGDDDTAIYVEDGAKPHWFITDAPTQKDAAVALLKLLEANPESPNMIPEHDPRATRHEPCPPEIRD